METSITNVKDKKSNSLKKSTVSTVIFKVVCVLLMSVIALTFIFVMVWMIANSFRPYGLYKKEPLNLFDFKNYTTEYYALVFKYDFMGTTYLQMLFNSLIHMSIGVIIGLIFEPLVGYVMAKFKYKKLNNILLVLIIITMTLPTIGTVYNTVNLMNIQLGLKNNWLNLVIQLSGGINFSAIIYMNYFNNIPSDYAESAYIDGASEFKTYINIYFVLCAPLLIATTVLRIISFWNDYYSIFLYMPDRPTIAYGLWYMKDKFMYESKDPAMFAALSITSLISLLLYGAFSKKIMSSLSVGGVKA